MSSPFTHKELMAAAEKAYGFPAANSYEVSERTVSCRLILAGMTTGLPQALDKALRVELARLAETVPAVGEGGR